MTTWMNLKDVLFREISRKKKLDSMCITYAWNLKERIKLIETELRIEKSLPEVRGMKKTDEIGERKRLTPG